MAEDKNPKQQELTRSERPANPTGEAKEREVDDGKIRATCVSNSAGVIRFEARSSDPTIRVGSWYEITVVPVS